MIIHKVTKTNFSLRKLGLLWVRLTLINFLLDILISTRDLETSREESYGRCFLVFSLYFSSLWPEDKVSACAITLSLIISVT